MIEETSRTVLLVDDCEDVASTLSELFSMYKVKTIVCNTAQCALDFLANHGITTKINAMVLDIRLPDGSGDIVLMAALSTIPGIRIVIYSGMVERDDLHDFQRIGAAAIVQKPALFSTLYLAAFPGEVV